MASEILPNTECSICYEMMTNDAPTVNLHDDIPSGGHRFHQRCIAEWFVSHNTCPLCRRVCHLPLVGEHAPEAQQQLANAVQQIANQVLITMNDLEVAVNNTHVNLLRQMLPLVELNPHQRGHLLRLASTHADEGIFNALFQNGPIPFHHREHAIGSAIRLNKIDLALSLIQPGTLSDEGRGELLTTAAFWGYPQVITALLTNGPVSHRKFFVSFIEASQSGSTEVINAMLNNARVEPRLLGLGLNEASQRGHREIVRILLRTGQVGGFAKSKAFASALFFGHRDLLPIFMNPRHVG